MLRLYFLCALMSSTFAIALSSYTQAQPAVSSQELKEQLQRARRAQVMGNTPQVSAETKEAFEEVMRIIDKVSNDCVDMFCVLNSLENQSPSKCSERVWGDLSGWAICVMSCTDAGFFSRTFGECS